MKVNRKGLRKLCRVRLEREEEDRSYVGEFDDKATVVWIREQLEMGNGWAWCCAKVTVSFAGFESEQYLGGCSYESRESFLKDGYYEQMVDEGLDEVAQQLESISNEHDLWEHDAITCLWCVVA